MSLYPRCVSWVRGSDRRRETARPGMMNESVGLCFISELLAGSFIFIILKAIIQK